MTTVHVTITNHDGRIRILEWLAFLHEAVDAVIQHASAARGAHGAGLDNLTLCFDIADAGLALKTRLAELAGDCPEAAITWAVTGDAEPITPAGATP